MHQPSDTFDAPIRDAASVVVLRAAAQGLSLLMGQRGTAAAFMPNKFVFPGGAVDPEDRVKTTGADLEPACLRRLSDQSDHATAQALVTAAQRELAEETGLVLRDASKLRFVFRAITPPGMPRRFDARFFICPAAEIESDLDDFSGAEDELSHLQWVPMDEVRGFDLPFITRVVLAEIAAMADPFAVPDAVPFYDHRDVRGEIRMIS